MPPGCYADAGIPAWTPFSGQSSTRMISQITCEPASAAPEACVATRHFYFVESPTFLLWVDMGGSKAPRRVVTLEHAQGERHGLRLDHLGIEPRLERLHDRRAQRPLRRRERVKVPIAPPEHRYPGDARHAREAAREDLG